MKLPMDAWHASFTSEIVLPAAIRDSLFEVYAEVERPNTLAEMMLAGRASAPQTEPNLADSALGLDRHGAGDLLATRIRAVLPQIESLPAPDEGS